MRLEERIRRLEKVVHPKDQVFTTKCCHRCGWTEKAIPPDFEGVVYQLVELAHCPDPADTPDTTHLTNEPAT